jgi:hypothetical protein
MELKSPRPSQSRKWTRQLEWARWTTDGTETISMVREVSVDKQTRNLQSGRRRHGAMHANVCTVMGERFQKRALI